MANRLAEYEKTASMMPGSVLIFGLQKDDTMKVFFYSEKARELTGMGQAEVDSTVQPDGFHMIIADDQKVIIEKVKAAIAAHEELDVLYRQYHKTRGMVWVHMKAAIVGEMQGIPVFLASMLDVTREMMNSVGVLEAADSSICVIEKHTKLLLYANSKFYEFIKAVPTEGESVYCYDVLCGNPAFQHDDKCLCFSTINIEKPFEYYNPEMNRYLSMYGREIMWGAHEAYVFFLADQTEEKFKDKQLKSAQERFEMTLDNSDLYIWEYDMVNNQCINPQKAVREYGLPPVIDNYPEALFVLGHTPPETIAQIKDVKRRLQNGETGFSVERRTVNADGEAQWMKVSYTLEKDINGTPVRALVCGTDITAQKQKEQAYEEELRLKKTVTADTTILAVLNLTQNKVAETDAQSPLLARYLSAGGVDDIMNAVCDGLISPSDQAAYRAHFSRAKMLENYDRGVLRDVLRHQFSYRSGWFESAYDLILNPATGDVQAITSIKDVTDEVRSQQVVSRLTAIDYDMVITVDTTTGAAYRFDRDGTMTADNGHKLTPAEYDAYRTGDILQYCAPEEAQRIAQEMKKETILQKLQTAPVYTFMYTLTVDGKVLRKRNIYTFLDNSRKTILFARQDVTEAYLQEEKQKKELSDALKKAEVANKAKTTFLSRVSHDMRTPLNGILGLTELMKDEVVNPAVLADLKKLEFSGKYLLDLINDVLDVSSIESGKMELHPTVCDGHLVLNNVVRLAKPNMDAKNIQLVLQAEGLSIVPIYIDEARLQQIAMNVLGNAAKFTPEGGRVEFICRTLSETPTALVNEFIVRDNGIGMDESFIPHLFEPFSQENAANTNSKTGTGLGMSITKKIVELMDGTVEVHSKKGQGTTVRVVLTFPVPTQSQLEESRTALQPSAHHYHLAGKRVLLCEDHPLNREIAVRILQKAGVLADCAENGKMGVEMFTKAPAGYYDAILMDIRMPVMDGLDATRAIRALPRPDAATVPILAMTANALDEDVKNTTGVGMNAHLSKPIVPLQLYQNLDKYTNL